MESRVVKAIVVVAWAIDYIGVFFFFLMIGPPPRSTLFPYTTPSRSARLPVRVRDPPPAAGHRGARDAARDPASRAGGDPHGPPPRHARRAALCRRELRRGAAAAVCGVRQDPARAAALSRSAALPSRSAPAPVRRHGPHAAAPYGRDGL